MMKILIIGLAADIGLKICEPLNRIIVETVEDKSRNDSDLITVDCNPPRIECNNGMCPDSIYDYSLIPCCTSNYDYYSDFKDVYPKSKSASKPKETFHHKYAHLFKLKKQIDCDGDGC